MRGPLNSTSNTTLANTRQPNCTLVCPNPCPEALRTNQCCIVHKCFYNLCRRQNFQHQFLLRQPLHTHVPVSVHWPNSSRCPDTRTSLQLHVAQQTQGCRDVNTSFHILHDSLPTGFGPRGNTAYAIAVMIGACSSWGCSPMSPPTSHSLSE